MRTRHGAADGPKVLSVLMDSLGLYRLLTWSSPSFPVGAYAYSHGVEYAVEIGLVTDRESLQDWIKDIVSFGSGRVDASLFCEAYRAAISTDDAFDRLIEITELSSALQATSELARESVSQGAAFLSTATSVWPSERLQAIDDLMKHNDLKLSHAVAVGIVSALNDLPLEASLTAYLHSFVANLVSAGVRLLPLGQTDGQRAIAALEPTIIAATREAMTRDFEDIGSATPIVDWTSTKHETQYTRLFRS